MQKFIIMTMVKLDKKNRTIKVVGTKMLHAKGKSLLGQAQSKTNKHSCAYYSTGEGKSQMERRAYGK